MRKEQWVDRNGEINHLLKVEERVSEGMLCHHAEGNESLENERGYAYLELRGTEQEKKSGDV